MSSSEQSKSAARGAVPTQFATFFLDKMLFGIDVQRVQEVIREQEMTPVPLAPEAVRGLINLRGQIIAAIDMRTRLGLEARSSEAKPMNVVITTSDGVVSLLVDSIGDVLEVETNQFECTPRTIDPCTKEVVDGVYKLKNQLLLVLNPERAAEVGQQISS